MSVCLSIYQVVSVSDWNRESWRILVLECIGKVAKLRTPFLEGSLAMAVTIGDRCQVTGHI